MISKLSGACYAVRSMIRISNVNINTLKSIYYTYYHSIIKYGIILGVTLTRVGRYARYKIKSGARPSTACGSLLQQLEILPVPCQYMNFLFNNQEIFQTNSFIDNINTRNNHHLHRPNINTPCF